MLSLYQKFLCCGSKSRAQSAQRVDVSRRSMTLYPCDTCKEGFSSQASLASHKHQCSSQTSARSQVKDSVPKKNVQLKNSIEAKVEEIKPREGRSIDANSAKKSIPDKNGRSDNSFGDLRRSGTTSVSITDTVYTDRVDKSSDGLLDRKRPSTLTLSTAMENEIEKTIKDLQNKPPRARREIELNFITRNIEKKTYTKFLISEQWIEKYTGYLNGDNRKLPEPINNEELKQMVIKKSLPSNIYLINEIIWRFVHTIYGGGPEIKQCNKAISFGNGEICDQSNDTQTADTFSRSESTRNSFLDTQKSSWYPNTRYLKPIGLTNPSFYCYMNSCLQMLLGITELSQYISHEKYKTSLVKQESKYWQSMTQIVHGHFRQQTSFTPKSLQQISEKAFDPDQQHDAHEFLRFLLSGMQDEVNLPFPKKEMEFHNPDSAWIYYRKYNISLVDDLLAGQLISTVTCTRCKHVSKTYDPFLDLSLPIIPEKTKNLDDCIDAFQHEEEIDDCYKCEKCKVKAKAIKKLLVHRCPKYLVINLKRFQTYPKKKKVKDPIAYPLTNWKIKDGATLEMASYSLTGVVVHFGPIDFGHYVCYTKRGEDWILCDDENISKVDEKEVASREAYILIYEKANQLGVSKL